jgi:hypothetical protein
VQKALIPGHTTVPKKRRAAKNAARPRARMLTTQEMAALKRERPLVTLRVEAGKAGVVVVVQSVPIITDLAAEWMYILRNRSRWSGDDGLRS